MELWFYGRRWFWQGCYSIQIRFTTQHVDPKIHTNDHMAYPSGCLFIASLITKNLQFCFSIAIRLVCPLFHFFKLEAIPLLPFLGIQCHSHRAWRVNHRLTTKLVCVVSRSRNVFSRSLKIWSYLTQELSFVAGIGAQTALKLIRQHGSLEKVLENMKGGR